MRHGAWQRCLPWLAGKQDWAPGLALPLTSDATWASGAGRMRVNPQTQPLCQQPPLASGETGTERECDRSQVMTDDQWSHANNQNPGILIPRLSEQTWWGWGPGRVNWSGSTTLPDAHTDRRGQFPSAVTFLQDHGLWACLAGSAGRTTLSLGRGPWKGCCFSLGLLPRPVGAPASRVESTSPGRYPSCWHHT